MHRMTIGLLTSLMATTALAAAPAGPASATPPLRLEGRTPLPDYAGDFDHLYADVAVDRLYLAAEDHGTLEVFELRSGQHLQSLTGFETPHSIFKVPGKQELLLTDGTDTIKRIDALTLQTIGGIKVHPGADSIGYDAPRDRLYVVTGGKDVKMTQSWLEEIQPDTGKVVASLRFDAAHVEAMAVAQHGSRLYINVTDRNELDVIDKGTMKVLARWPIRVARQNALATLDEQTNRLFIVTRDPARMIVLDAQSGATVASFEAPGHADGEVFDPLTHRDYVPGGDGWIGVYQELDANHVVMLPRIASAAGAKTTTLVEPLQRLYVGVSPGEQGHGGAVLWFHLQNETH